MRIRAVMSMLMLIQAWRRTTDIWDSPILIHPFLYLLLDFSLFWHLPMPSGIPTYMYIVYILILMT